jgi:hypothetical protein
MKRPTMTTAAAAVPIYAAMKTLARRHFAAPPECRERLRCVRPTTTRSRNAASVARHVALTSSHRAANSDSSAALRGNAKALVSGVLSGVLDIVMIASVVAQPG